MELTTITKSDFQSLRTPTKTITFPLSDDIKKFITEFTAFIETLASPYGKPAGLAATQVGVSLPIFLMQIPEEAKKIRKDVFDVVPLTLCINPRYTPIVAEGKYKDWEGCYSVPEKMGEVYRYRAIHYEAQTIDGEVMVGETRGLLARIMQHEIGHLNGELYTDLLAEDCRFGSLQEMWELRKQEL